MLCDGDCFYTADIVSKYRAVCGTHNGTFVFRDTQSKVRRGSSLPLCLPSITNPALSTVSPKPIYSYVTANADDEVTDIKEKIKISDHANTGCYCFSNGCQLEKYCKKIIEAGAMQLSQVHLRLSSILISLCLPSPVCPQPNTEDAWLTGPEGRVLHVRRDQGDAGRPHPVQDAAAERG